VGQGCGIGNDCTSGVCNFGTCAAISCNDGIKNGTETDIDCGGSCAQKCLSGKACQGAGDCDSGRCDAGACVPVLLISELQTRGSNGGNDEFVEIYNPTSEAVIFDTSWKVQARSAVGTCTSNAQADRIVGAGQTIPAHKHLLYTNNGSSGYDGAVTGDGTYSTGIVDAASVVLLHGATVIDALCFSFDAATQSNLLTCATPYTCEGAPVSNLPHNNTTAGSSNSDQSLDRKPGGASGNGQDTNVNNADFASVAANPQNLSKPATP
jgi:hypothetical protein